MNRTLILALSAFVSLGSSSLQAGPPKELDLAAAKSAITTRKITDSTDKNVVWEYQESPSPSRLLPHIKTFLQCATEILRMEGEKSMVLTGTAGKIATYTLTCKKPATFQQQTLVGGRLSPTTTTNTHTHETITLRFIKTEKGQ